MQFRVKKQLKGNEGLRNTIESESDNLEDCVLAWTMHGFIHSSVHSIISLTNVFSCVFCQAPVLCAGSTMVSKSETITLLIDLTDEWERPIKSVTKYRTANCDEVCIFYSCNF